MKIGDFEIGKESIFIIAEAGLNSKSIVVEAGTGSGGLGCMLGRICKKVFSYDINAENTEPMAPIE